MSRYAEPLDQDIPWSISSLQLHGDDFLGDTQDIAPPLHVSSTYRYPRKTEDLVPLWKLKLPADVRLYFNILDGTNSLFAILIKF